MLTLAFMFTGVSINVSAQAADDYSYETKYLSTDPANGYQLKCNWLKRNVGVPHNLEVNTPRMTVKDGVIYMVKFKTYADDDKNGVELLRFNAETGEQMSTLTLGNKDAACTTAVLNHRFEQIVQDDAGNLLIICPFNRRKQEANAYYDYVSSEGRRYGAVSMVKLDGATEGTFDLDLTVKLTLPTAFQAPDNFKDECYVIDGMDIVGDWSNGTADIYGCLYNRYVKGGPTMQYGEIYKWSKTANTQTDLKPVYVTKTKDMSTQLCINVLDYGAGGTGNRVAGRYYILNSSGPRAPMIGTVASTTDWVKMFTFGREAKQTGCAVTVFDLNGSKMMAYTDMAGRYNSDDGTRMIRFRVVELPAADEMAGANAVLAEKPLWDFPANGLTEKPAKVWTDGEANSLENTTAICSEPTGDGARIYVMGQGEDGTGLASYEISGSKVNTLVEEIGGADESLRYDGTCVISGADSTVTVYSISGFTVKAGVGRVDVSDLPAGVYVVKAGSKVMKLKI